MTKKDEYKGLKLFEKGDYKSKREIFLKHSMFALLSSI